MTDDVTPPSHRYMLLALFMWRKKRDVTGFLFLYFQLWAPLPYIMNLVKKSTDRKKSLLFVKFETIDEKKPKYMYHHNMAPLPNHNTLWHNTRVFSRQSMNCPESRDALRTYKNIIPLWWSELDVLPIFIADSAGLWTLFFAVNFCKQHMLDPKTQNTEEYDLHRNLMKFIQKSSSKISY